MSDGWHHLYLDFSILCEKALVPIICKNSCHKMTDGRGNNHLHQHPQMITMLWERGCI